MKLSKELNFICFLLVFCFVNSQQIHQQQQQQQKQNHQQRHHGRRIQQNSKVRRIYAMCPPSFTKIGNECYHLSSTKASWLDSHFECKDKNAKLAEPLKYSDRLLRKYLMQRGRTRGDIWIGGMYNWQRNKWQWGYNGKDMTYQSFSQMNPGEDLKYHCSILNPELKYRWSAKLCFEKHYYLCQHRMPYVSEKNRQRIYTRWNETFPGQMANEIQVYVTSPNGNRREMQRSGGNTRRPTVTTPQQKKVPQNQTSRNQGGQRNNQLPVDTRRISNEINPPEIVSAQDTQLRRKKQQKDKSKESRTSKLTGDVDLGRNFLKKNLNKQPKSRRRQESRTSTVPTVTTSTTTTESPNSISQIYPVNPHRHNHYNSNNNDDDANNRRIDKSSRREDTYRNQQSYSTVSTMTANSGNIYNTTTELTASKQIEKKKRLDNVREKLSRLTDEEKMEFLKLKAQRKAQRNNKSINDTTS
ncbi:probable basic-leucine zipper transcription factor K [Chironomus tepperi]|uniref:probable basic-leucine zipper transcription factor K n=1 Tax=Chironomus tepperi TaxID=113505 RepID=UPI00391F1B52